MKERRRLSRLGLTGGAIMVAGATMVGWAYHKQDQATETYNTQKREYSATQQAEPKKKELEKIQQFTSDIADSGKGIALTGGVILAADLFIFKSLSKKSEPQKTSFQKVNGKYVEVEEIDIDKKYL